MRALSAYLLLSLCIVSCEEKADIPRAPEDTGLLAVEGVLTNENRNHRIRLTLPYANQNGESEPATGASVYVFEDTTVSVLTEFPPGSGNYYTPLGRAVFGKLYTLIIQYDGKQYFAQDWSVPVEPLQDLKYRQTAVAV